MFHKPAFSPSMNKQQEGNPLLQALIPQQSSYYSICVENYLTEAYLPLCNIGKKSLIKIKPRKLFSSLQINKLLVSGVVYLTLDPHLLTGPVQSFTEPPMSISSRTNTPKNWAEGRNEQLDDLSNTTICSPSLHQSLFSLLVSNLPGRGRYIPLLPNYDALP